MATVTINGKEYDSEQMSAEAKKHLASIQFVDRRIAELKSELAVLQTARNAYGRALAGELNEGEEVIS